MATFHRLLLTLLLICHTGLSQPIDHHTNFIRTSSFRRIGNGRTHSSLFSEFSKGPTLTVREKEIAAVFRGVAYGVTESPEPTQLTTITSAASQVTPGPSTTSKPVTVRTTTSKASPINVEVEETLETLKVLPPFPTVYSSSPSDHQQSRNGILNYFVEENRDNYNNERRDYYPEVISSVKPKTNVPSDSNKFLVSDNGTTKSISVHVYMIGVLMGLIVVASLLCLCRITSCTQLIPRGHYVTLQLLILLSSSLRCITLFHDPYGLDGKLPRALMSLLVNSVAPLLSTAFALMLLVLLRASKYFLIPACLQSPLILAVICGTHIGTTVLVDISNGVLDYPESSHLIEVGMQCVTVAWDIILVIAYIVLLYHAFIKPSKRRVLLPISTCCVMMIAVTIKAILIGFMLYHVIMRGFNSHQVSHERTWSWWVLISCERLLEIGFCAALLTAAATLTMKQVNLSTKEQKVFSVISGYDQNTIRVASPTHKNFKAANYVLASTLQKKGNTMNSNISSRTLLPNTAKVSDNNGEFSVQWNTNRNKPDVCPRTIENNSSNFTRTLPAQPRYYCAPVPHIGNSPVPGRIEPYTLRPQKTNDIYSEIEDVVPASYDVASYYTQSELNSSDVYNSPSITMHHQYAQAQSSDHLYDLPNVHNVNQSRRQERQYQPCHTTYSSTDADSSFNLVLPLQNSHGTARAYHQKLNNPQLDTSPDSAIVLDYSSHSELEEQNIAYMQQQQQMNQYQERKMNPSSKLDFMNLSTHSLNEVFKHNSGLLSKLVGNNNNTNTGYQPLNLEDTISCTVQDTPADTSSPSRKSTLKETIGNSSVNEGESNYPPPAVSTPLISSPSPVTSL